MCNLSELPQPQCFIYWHPNWPWSLLKKTSLKLICAYYLEIKKKEYPGPFIRPCVKNRKRRVQAFSFLGSGKDLHKILRRYESVKYIFIWTFHLKLPDFWRKFFVCFVESHFIFYYNRIAFNAPLKSSSRCFCKRRIPLFKRPWNWNVYSVRHLWLHLWMPQQSVMFVSEPGRLQRSRWKTLVRIVDFE